MANRELNTYAKVTRKIWHTAQFRALSREARELYLYIITCPHGNMLGMFVLRPGYVVDDLRLSSRQRFAQLLGELLHQHLVAWDEEAEIILDLEYLDKHPLDNPNQVKAAVKKLDELPKTKLFSDLKQLIERLGKPLYEPLLKRLDERLGQPVTVTVTVTGTEEPPYPPLRSNPTSRSKGNGNAFTLPAFIPQEEWDAFVEMRLRKGTLTNYAKKLIADKLAKLQSMGHDPGDVLRQSVERGWKGVFPVKPEDKPYDPDSWIKKKLAEQKGGEADDAH